MIVVFELTTLTALVYVISEKSLKLSVAKIVKPTIEFAAVSSSVDADGKLTFSKPTATDKFDTLPEFLR